MGGSGPNNVYVVGATGGKIFHSTGNDQWGAQMSPTTKDLFGVSVDEATGDAFAVGRGGTFIRASH